MRLKIAISSGLCISDWHEIWQAAAAGNRFRGWSRIVVKQFQDGGRSPFWKSIYRHISVKFCTRQQILNWMNVTWHCKNEKVALDKLRVRQNVFLLLLLLLLLLIIIIIIITRCHPLQIQVPSCSTPGQVQSANPWRSRLSRYSYTVRCWCLCTRNCDKKLHISSS